MAYKRNKPYSFSSLQLFENCPYAFLLKDMGFQQMSTLPLEFGSAAHDILAMVIREPRLLTSDTKLESLTRKVVQQWPLVRDNEKNIEELLTCVKNTFSVFDPSEYEDVKVEERLTLKITDDDDIVVIRDFCGKKKGMMVPVYHVRDWKTGWKPRTDPYDKQIGLYLWATQKQFPNAVVEGALHYCRYKKNAVFPIGEPDESYRWAVDTIGKVKQAYDEPGDMGFPKKPGHNCTWCGYSYACLNTYLPQTISGDTEAQDVGALALRLESALKTAKELLKRYLGKENSVQINDEYWGTYKYNNWTFEDIQAFKDLLESNGIDSTEYLTVNGFKLKALMKGPLGDQIRAIGRIKTSSYFTHRDVPPNGPEDEAEGEEA